ncbi:Hypoxanthine phosphoribosyltransferase [Mycoplasma haemocanis str. Illinois]|uniref:Hypoxanthine-guanine phosphoribosyltransferase n=1 Tax=Mycoplasma haemocanis (strain Illinois) TaxID=1111676 RepID=H6N5J3_MYCHN|nr:phosphoribosyltransferase family protein [Mycoplasma haemocanis]AEW44953.1 Hypoxanthine phosphoribosyltransferase [Mycoplasma haemocanis str. Illinois]
MSKASASQINLSFSVFSKVLKSCFDYALQKNLADEDTCKSAISKLDSLLEDNSFSPNLDSFLKSSGLTLDEIEVLNKFPRECILDAADKLVIKYINESVFRGLYGFRNTLRDLAIEHKNLFQGAPFKDVASLGYRFALYYSSLRELLERVHTARRYVELVNRGSSLDSYLDCSVELQDFLSPRLELFHSMPFSSNHVRWFSGVVLDMVNFGREVISDFQAMEKAGQASLDSSLISMSLDAFNRAYSFLSSNFSLELTGYRDMIIAIESAFDSLEKSLLNIKLNKDAIVSSAGYDRQEERALQINEVFLRVFDVERKREVIGESFFEYPELDNIIFRLAGWMNNVYRGETEEVLLVGFAEGAIVLLGRIIPLLNFPTSLLTIKFSLYKEGFSADTSQVTELEFDENKYDGRRVIIFDDLMESGTTVKEFIKQMYKKVKVKDHKVCTLFTKPVPEREGIESDFVGAWLPYVWVVGYGFDLVYKHRNVDAVASINPKFLKS